MSELTRRPQERETDEQRMVRWREVAKEARARWERALPVTKDHPYLKRKGLKADPDPKLIRADGSELVVPLMGLEKEGGAYPLWSLQRILPAGNKTKLFLAGGRARGTRAPTIGMEHVRWRNKHEPEPGQTIYICEGWATAWTIAHVMQVPVIPALMKENYEDIVKFVQATYRSALSVVVAADNDRFNAVNVGVKEAKRWAYSPWGRFAIPSFLSDEKRGTDFNDLWLEEGYEVVRFWLNPNNAGAARLKPLDPSFFADTSRVDASPVAPAGDTLDPRANGHAAEPVDHQEVAQAELEGWLTTARFRLLGHNRGVYYFLPRSGGQIVPMAPSSLERISNLCQLETLGWWQSHFEGGGKSGVNTVAAADALIQASHRSGIYRPDNVRGRGCWREADEAIDHEEEQPLLLHLGDRMVVPNVRGWVQPDEYQSPGGYTYERQMRMNGPASKAMAADEARDVLDIFRTFMWRDNVAGDLLAGWTFLAPVGGALPWRPHVWVIGERGSGKSTIVEKLVVPLLTGPSDAGGTCLYVVGENTEAGLRQGLFTDSLPVVFDEAEEGEGVGARIQKVLALARQASSGSDARTLKGTTHGGAVQYRIRSMFCLASIGGAIWQEADKSRISLLPLLGDSQVDKERKRTHWDKLEPRIVDITKDTGRRMFTRAIKLLRSGALLDTIRTFRKVGGRVYGDQRTGDQHGTLYAGAWHLQSDESPSEQDAYDVLTTEGMEAHLHTQQPEGIKALQMLMQQRERIDTASGPRTLTVGQLVGACAQGGQVCPEADAKAALDQLGLRVEGRTGGYVLLVSPTSAWSKKVFADTIYARGLLNVMLGLEGVAYEERPVRFYHGHQVRPIMVPFSLLSE